MSGQDLLNRLKQKFGDRITGSNLTAIDPWIEVAPEGLVEVCKFLRDDAAWQMNYLNCITAVDYFEKDPMIPQSSLPMFAAVLPWVEGILGALLVVGLFSRFTMIAGSLVMAGLVFGTNMAQDWKVAGLQLIYCFIYYFLLARREELNKYSIDGMMGKN